MGVTRKNSNSADAMAMAVHILLLDRELMAITTGENCLTLAAKDQLARMQRKLRKMRIDIEVEAGLPEISRVLLSKR